MEHDPKQQPIEQRHRRLTPDQQEHAKRDIERAIDNLSEQEPTVSRDIARTIAASLHTGAGSVLEHFAATDRLDPKQALAEAHEAIRRRDHGTWGVALAMYLERIDRPRPDLRPLAFKEPPPEVFLRSPRSGNADWIPLIGSAQALELRLQSFDPTWTGGGELQSQLDRSDWEIGNVVGFYGTDLKGVGSLRGLFRLAQGIITHGEGFAAYLALFGVEYASRYSYKQLHVSDVDNITELVASFAYAHDLLHIDNKPGEDRTRAPTVSSRLIERTLGHDFVWHAGREQLHVFARDVRGRNQRQPDENE